MVNEIVYLIYFSDLLLLMYSSATDFCVLILYPATLPNSLMSSSSFLVASLGFYLYSMSYANSDNFTSSFFFSNLDSFYFFFPLTAMARTSKTMLNNNNESGHPCLVLRGNACYFYSTSIF